ncbi:uncharacterized protein LOC111079619 [Drosophila obscura]|uniref:uncharacterized protein LOC111079619 n=1 Tax=Drosophila obscura TaxID=7282 RepID=UPI001BB212A6|nr:uncharacterized protein LOC111079619 [Drosophila obscura]
MNPNSRMCVPLFILFALILATIWGFINREDLLGAYHKQLHGDANVVGVEWMDKLAQLTDPINAVIAMAAKDTHKNISKDNVATIQPLYQYSDENENEAEEEEEDKLLMLQEYPQEEDDEPEEKGSTNHPLMAPSQDEKLRKLLASPDSDLKREFASDKANPYIEGINENYELSSK